MWKRLTGGREVDPDFYVEEGPDAVYESYGYATRVYGWEGRMFPRLAITVHDGRVKEQTSYMMKTPRLSGPSFKVACSYKSAQGQWWHTLDGVPFAFHDDTLELINEAKMKVSAKGEGQ